MSPCAPSRCPVALSISAISSPDDSGCVDCFGLKGNPVRYSSLMRYVILVPHRRARTLITSLKTEASVMQAISTSVGWLSDEKSATSLGVVR